MRCKKYPLNFILIGIKTMKLRITYNALKNQSTDWIKKSANNPNQFMSKNVIRLHYLVLKNRGEL
jgi:hypothetical protein